MIKLAKLDKGTKISSAARVFKDENEKDEDEKAGEHEALKTES